MIGGRTRAYGLLAPAMIFIAVGFLLPVGWFLARSLIVRGSLSFDHYADFFSSPLNREVFWRTLRLGLEVTFTCAAIGYAVALAVAEGGEPARGRLLGLIVLPLMISPVARTYAWIVILGRTGPVNNLIVGLALSSAPLRLLFSETAVFIGLVQLFLPMMVISLVSALENLPRDVVPAARILGAGPVGAFVKVILPLTREGLLVGGTLVFTGSLTAYITPAILGGSKVLMLETLLYQRVSVANDVVSASVIGVILTAMSFVTNALLRRIARGRSVAR
jgi:putative spermidine/putrescine transport system permease protein